MLIIWYRLLFRIQGWTQVERLVTMGWWTGCIETGIASHPHTADPSLWTNTDVRYPLIFSWMQTGRKPVKTRIVCLVCVTYKNITFFFYKLCRCLDLICFACRQYDFLNVDSHIDSCPYASVYLSPPPDTSWRRWELILFACAEDHT